MDAFSLNSSGSARAIPARAGVGLKAKHYEAILRSTPDVGFFEVHAENYMGAGGPPHRYLEAVRSRYPLSIHGVGLSIGSSGPLDRGHLLRLKTLISRYEPGLVSEHLAWSTHAGEFLNDLLPIPYTQETLALVCERVDEVQTILGRRILIENPATYIAFSQTTIPEKEFLAAIAQRTGCGLLLDINNICVSAMNHGFDAKAYLDAFPAERVGEIHLAGAAMNADGVDDQFLIDAHDRSIGDDVWALYVDTLHRAGPIPTLVEWDNDVPSWPVLVAEARRAEALLRRGERDKVRIEASNAVHAL